MAERPGAGPVVRAGVLAALLAVVAVAAIVLIDGGSGGHRVHVVFEGEASHAMAGLDVRAAGQRVGEVVAVEPHEGHARLELELDDEVWPLTRGTSAQLRWGGTIAIANRHVELRPGRPDAPPVAEGATIEGPDSIASVEFDQVFRGFDRKTRADVDDLFRTGAPAMEEAQDDLRRALRKSPPAFTHARAFLEDLGDDPRALDMLVRTGDRVAGALADADPGIRELVGGAADTFEAFGSRASAMERAIVQTAPTLASTRPTLARAERTLRSLDSLGRRLRPGIEGVRRLTGPATSALRRIVDVGPVARDTLDAAQRSAPDITALLAQAAPLMPTVASVGRQGASQLRCVRPYAPEIGGVIGTWLSATASGDNRDRFARVHASFNPHLPGDARTPAALLRDLPQTTYAFPRAPGLNAGQPWFLPSCGVGPETLDPTQDPESRAPAAKRKGNG